MTAGWPTTLDALERHLDRQARLVQEGRYDEVAAFDPPADLPPLPHTLAARAGELIGRSQALTELGVGLRIETSTQLARRGRRTSARRPVSAYIDQRA
jgi:hypothetical protein